MHLTPAHIDSPRRLLQRGALRLGVAAVVAAALALVGPLFWAAAHAGAGLLLLILLGVLGMAGLRVLPLLGQRLENRLLAARKEEAHRSPLEQLERFLLGRTAQVAAFKSHVGHVGAELRSLEELLQARRRQRPDVGCETQERSLAEMKRAHAVLTERYLEAERALEALHRAVDDKRFEWRFSVAGRRALVSLGEGQPEESLDRLLADEAFSAIRDNFHRAFAELELEARRLASPAAAALPEGAP